MKTILLSLFVGLGLIQTHAAIIQFDLTGSAGLGMLAANNGVLTGGSGGEIGTGITFNDATSVLTVNVGWGSANGFTDLSSLVNNQHIHGPTLSEYGNGFTQTASVAINLTRTSTSPSSGMISNNTATLTAAQITNLFTGRYYINVHTANNGGGEIRGFLVAVPQLSLAVSNSQASLLVSGVTGQKQVVQVSTNFLNWTPAGTNTTGTNRFQFVENNPQQNSRRYYRAVVIP